MLNRLCGLVLAALTTTAVAQGQTHWVGTWATSPMGVTEGWSMKVFSGTTVREIVHISAGGAQVRVRFTNEFSPDPLTLRDAHVAVSAGGGAVKDGTDHPVTFGGATSVRIAPGAAIYSDPVAMEAAPLSDLAISFYVPAQTMRAETFHGFADQDGWIAQGNVSGAATLPSPTKLTSWYFISGVDVPATEGSKAIVMLGDSITDGALSTANANRRWPDVLAGRLNQERGMEHVSVLNEGIGGNRVLNEGFGPSAISRFDRDVLAQNGAKYLVVLEGINDIGRLQRLSGPEDEITAETMEFGLKQIVDAAHLHGLKVYGATLTPYGGAGYSTDKGEQIREAVNQWIRTSGTFDGVIDFDQITRDPQNPNRFNPLYDSGDHLHPNDAGYKAMGEGIDLKLFR
ncbi:SGNH/GDSL hydrolase family protein [Occallatibacter riparius]|uniref:SGNH/GDSL hydrolase family protein n=1 Tax=Occallatibacter riparius TaxID=1002689 RepID=A0A9J7BHI5_9BACT|nr:SGNH/GDSL hydrolase family protein [Occallatibacter riparius]UWZ82420.1 SGNH/GDSL hydrolase family protein [Occallatibacter riparius]